MGSDRLHPDSRERAEAVFLAAAASREKRHITLDDIAAETSIGVGFLSAIETLAFDRLPGGIYDRSYIRQYAKAAGFDEQEFVSAYLTLRSGFEATDHPTSPSKGPLSHVRQYWQRVVAALSRRHLH